MNPLPEGVSVPDLRSERLGGDASAAGEAEMRSQGGTGKDTSNETLAPVFRQLRLFAAENPMRARFPRDFMRTVPREPGVYYFRDAAGGLLYVGQSHELRKRVGSYRHVHPDRHPRRLVRLVHEVRQIEWETCASQEAAIERERELLLELRPGFNRAGVWKPPPWWLRVGVGSGLGHTVALRIDLCTEGTLPSGAREGGLEERVAQPHADGDDHKLVGPFPASFRWVHAALLRCLHRWLFPEIPLHKLPAGLMAERVPRQISWIIPVGRSANEVVVQIYECFQASGGHGDSAARPLLSDFAAFICDDLPPMEKAFWQTQVETVVKFVGKWGQRTSSQQESAAEASGASVPTPSLDPSTGPA